MWIRSQDKKSLLKIDNVYIEYDYYKVNASEDDSLVYVIKSNKKWLGIYKTEEIAMKLLNDIQNALCSNYVEVYNMPEYDIELEEL